MIRRAIYQSLALCLCACLAVPVGGQMPSSYWVNVLDYGAKGDGITDDTPAILRAIRAAINYKNTGGTTSVYFPAGHYFRIGSTLTLPPTPNWLILFFDGGLQLDATIVAATGYVFRGNQGGQIPAFSKNSVTQFNVRPSANPAIRIEGVSALRLENIAVANIPNGVDGIVVDHSSNITFKNVWALETTSNSSGIPVKIHGGFGYYFDGGGYVSGSEGNEPAMLFVDGREPGALGCGYSGIVRVRGIFLVGHGIKMDAPCGGMNDYTFEDILFESFREPFLTISSRGYGVWGISLKDVNVADPAVQPYPPLVEANGNNIFSVTIMKSGITLSLLVGGDATIHDLEIWTAWDHQRVTQSSEYVLHGPYGIISTMKVIDPRQPSVPLPKEDR